MKIPKGWRELRNGTAIKHGDRFWCANSFWTNSSGPKNGHVGAPNNIYDGEVVTYIRRIKRKPNAKR